MFSTGLNLGQEISNEQIMEIFKCGNMGGMRRSIKTSTLVIVSDHTKGLYDDKWLADVLHYTGMGLRGNQSLMWSQNKTLYESNENGVDVFLFEVFKSKHYTYRGQVKLISKPYEEVQKDIDGNNRNVWIFPLKLVE